MIWGALAAVGSVYLLWVFYLAVMALKRARDAGTISPVALALGYPVLLVGLLLDVAVNAVVMTALLLEWPRELTVSKRLARHLRADVGWRRFVAMQVCKRLLDTFDPSGSHCK